MSLIAVIELVCVTVVGQKTEKTALKQDDLIFNIVLDWKPV